MTDSNYRLFATTGVPGWFPGETLFSLCSRFHRLTGNATAETTANMLFGHKLSGYQHDLPSGIKHFVGVTEGSHGNVNDVIRQHTLLPFYLPLRSEHDANDAYTTMAGNTIGSLKYRLGILTSRFRANHPLKACLACLQEDTEQYGVGYWHLEHQYPGVWICLKHRQPLLVSDVKSTGLGRFQWYLPEEETLRHVIDRQIISNQLIYSKYFALAESAISLGKLPATFHFDLQKLLETYHYVLQQHGLLTEHHNLRLKSISEAYLDAIHPLLMAPDLAYLPTTSPETMSHVGKLLRLPRSGTHPLRHLLLIHWLFKNWDIFWKAYSTYTPTSQLNNTLAPQEPVLTNIEMLRNQLLNLVNNDNITVTHAANHLGIDTTTAIIWAQASGMVIQRRPKSVTDEIRTKIITQLKRGRDKVKIADKYHVSIATVSRILRSEIGLQQKWADVRFLRMLKTKRRQWQKQLETHEHLGIKAVRLIIPATYAWLYRNDRNWLEETNQIIPILSQSNHSNVDWDRRDHEYATHIQKIALRFHHEHPASQLTLTDIFISLPDLKAKFTRLDKLPLTYKALQVALGRKFNRRTADLIS